ncbi:MAG: universal stress protein [Gammaproteobacteria bacterium]
MNNHVLVIADQEPSSMAALQKASEFVSPATAQITVLAFIDTGGPSRGDISHNERLEALDVATKKCFGSRSRISLDIVSTAEIAGYCADFCTRQQVELVIKTGHRSESLVYTPLDWQLIRALPCPVIIAVNHRLSAERKLLVTLDVQTGYSHQKALDTKVLKWAGEWCDQHDYSLYVACCVEASDPLTNADLQMLMDLEAKMRPRIEPVVQQMLSRLSLACKAILITAGSPVTALRRLADELDADLVVLGFTARHGLGQLLVGHTAEKLMHKLDRNLAVVPDKPGV